MKNLISWAKIVVLVAALILPVNAFADSYYQPGAIVEVMTEVTVADIPGSPSVYRLTVGPAKKSENTVYVDFSNAGSGETMGRLEFFQDQRIAWQGVQTTAKQLQSSSLLIVPGISIPVDVLPVNRLFGVGEPEIFEFQKSAHGQIILDRIRVTASPVNLDQARQSQWIKVEDNIPDSLYMIGATDVKTGALIVKQLWAPGNSWWLYEQTPFRRSWRVQ